MRIVSARNVNDAWYYGARLLSQNYQEEVTRNGPCWVAPWPVTTAYSRPTERVLFDPVRDANPFFHLIEALWMLGGRQDAKLPGRYARNLLGYAEDDGIIHGAYGYRWRWAFGLDQLNEVVSRLQAKPTDRQAVIQMWDCTPDAYDGQADLQGEWRDRPCNTHIYLRVREQVLDMTVCCRSNDIVWGCYGANAVHMSVLQEYLAARIGVGVGTYYQVSNNFHAYPEVFQKAWPPERPSLDSPEPSLDNPYVRQKVAPSPLVTDPVTFDAELEELLRRLDEENFRPFEAKNTFLSRTAWMVALAFDFRRRAQPQTARDMAGSIEATDWRRACCEWLERRTAKNRLREEARA